MTPHDVTRILASLTAAADHRQFAGTLVDALAGATSPDGVVAILPRDAGASAQPDDVFASGDLLEPHDPHVILSAMTSDRLQSYLSDRGAAYTLGPVHGGLGPVVLGWRTRPADGDAVSASANLLVQLGALVLQARRSSARADAVAAALKDAEDQIARTGRARAVGELASGIVHDFNNCLTTILGFAELALGPLTPADAHHDDLMTIRTAAMDAAALVRRLQTVGGRTRSEQREVVDLRDVAKAMPSLIKPRLNRRAQVEGVRFDLALDLQPSPPVYVVLGEIRELLLNVLFNAIDAMPSGGRIAIITGTSDGLAQIAVRDEGTGMTDEVQARLFQPFFTTKGERGTGLGLSVGRSIAKRHGGMLTVRSSPGLGSTFTLTLPPAPAELMAEEVGPQLHSGPTQARLTPQRVLLVDDQPEVLESVGEMLRVLGHHVVTAADGHAALAVAHRQRFDVVLTDFGMPVMNGADLGARLLTVASETPVILVTGWGLENEAALPANIVHVMSKPLSMKALAEGMLKAQSARVSGESRRTKCS